MVLFYAQDPGGANVIVRVAGAMRPKLEGPCTIAVHPLAAAAFARAGVDAQPLEDLGLGEIPAGDVAVARWLDVLQPSHVICTTSSRHVDLTNARVIERARHAGVPTLGFLDHWVGFDRFQDEAGTPAYLPDVLAVPDEYCRERVESLGARHRRVEIVGHPHLEAVAREVPPAARASGPVRVVVVSQPVVADGSYTGALFLEHGGARTIDLLIDALRPGIESGDLVLSYRPHPKERRGDQLPPEMGEDKGAAGLSLLTRHDIFVGVTSMVLFEAAVARRQVIQLDLPELRRSVQGDWPPYAAGSRLMSLGGFNAEVGKAVKQLRDGVAEAGVPGLALEGSLDRSVALCESFLS